MLRATGGALATAVAAGTASAADGSTRQDDGLITLSNGQYEVEFHPTNTGVRRDWTYDGTATLFEELYALRAGDGTLLASSESTHASIEEGYPSVGDPGESYEATASLANGSHEVSVRRSVELEPNDPRFTVVYEIENTSGDSMDAVQFYQYVDYDVSLSTGDVGEYDDSEGLFWQGTQSGTQGAHSGFKGSRRPDSWAVGEYPSVGDQISQGSLSGSASHSGDVSSALRWDLGSIASGESVTLAVGFAAGDSRADVEMLLDTVENPSADATPSSDEDGDGGSSGGDGDDSLPGFGIGAAAAGIGGYAYSRLRGDDAE